MEVFFSYAHTDENLKNELLTHLSLLQRQGIITGWHDRLITAGADWKDEIDRHLDIAGIILLLVSAGFLASNYCWDIEVKRAMERHESGKARVIPVILRPVHWAIAPFAKLQALPKNARPVTEWRNRDAAYKSVVEGIYVVLNELGPPDSASNILPAPHPVQESGRAEAVIEFEVPLEDLDIDKLGKIIEEFKQMSGDTSIRLKKVKRGSVKLTIEGSEEGIARLLELYKVRTVDTVLGYQVRSAKRGASSALVTSKLSVESEVSERWEEVLRQAAITLADDDEPKDVRTVSDNPAVSENPEEVLLRLSERESIINAIRQLPDKQRKAIILYFAELSYQQIAEILGISAHSAKIFVYRAQRQLGKTLADFNITKWLRP